MCEQAAKYNGSFTCIQLQMIFNSDANLLATLLDHSGMYCFVIKCSFFC